MKKAAITFSLTTYYLLLTTAAHAVCPVCTVAVGAGLGLTRYFGVDDTVSGVWVGGIVLSSSLWLADWLHKKGLKIKLTVLSVVTVAFMFAATLIPLSVSKVIGHPFNTIFGIDKLIFGITLGTIVFILAVRMDKLVRKVKGHQLFVYQKVIFPVLSLLITSGLMYLYINSLKP